jgi:antitoxin CptB
MTWAQERSICRAMNDEATRTGDAPPSARPEAELCEDAQKGVRIQRVRFRAWRRGFKEADLVLGGFADAHAAALDAADLDRFEALLNEEDAELYAWIVGRAEPPPEHDHDLFARIRAFCASGGAKGARAAE